MKNGGLLKTHLRRQDVRVDRVYTTVEPCCTVTSVRRSPRHYGHPGTIPNYFHNSKIMDISSTDMITSLFSSLMPSYEGELYSEVPAYIP